MTFEWARNGASHVTRMQDGYQLEVKQAGQVWKWYAYAGGVPYGRGEADSLESAKAKAESTVRYWLGEVAKP